MPKDWAWASLIWPKSAISVYNDGMIFNFRPVCWLILTWLCVPGLWSTTDFPLPTDGAIPGWSRSESERRYAPGNLFDYINGGAEIFNEFGFQALLVQTYSKEALEITVELYRMDGAPAALAMFIQQGGQNQGRPEDPQHIARSPYQWTLQKGPWYIQLNAPASARGLDDHMAAFAEGILAQIKPEPVQVFSALPIEERIAGSEFLVRGPYGMQPVFTFGEGDLLQLEGIRFAIGAEYRDSKAHKTTQMIIPYQDADQARGVLKGLDGRLDSYIKVLEKGVDHLIFMDFKQEYGFIRRVDNRLEIGLHLTESPQKKGSGSFAR